MIKFKISYFKYLTENFITFKILTLINGISSNLSETTIILKCVSDPLGTLCIYDSFIISIQDGFKESINFFLIENSTELFCIALHIFDTKNVFL